MLTSRKKPRVTATATVSQNEFPAASCIGKHFLIIIYTTLAIMNDELWMSRLSGSFVKCIDVAQQSYFIFSLVSNHVCKETILEYNLASPFDLEADTVVTRTAVLQTYM